MNEAHIRIEHLSLNIPVFMPGQLRLIRKSNLVAKVGGRINNDNGKISVAALRDISVTVTENENLALIGPNGAGKSTLLKVIAGIYPASSGTVSVTGNIGCLLEMGIGMSDEMTGRECVKYHCAIFTNDLSRWREVAEEIADFTELGQYMDMPIRTYSSGMRTRLSAALATAWQRDILLMDEGIGAGDASFHAKFEDRLEKFMQSSRLLVFASHSIDLLKLYCSRGLVLESGEVRFYGDLDDALDYYKSTQ